MEELGLSQVFQGNPLEEETRMSWVSRTPTGGGEEVDLGCSTPLVEEPSMSSGCGVPPGGRAKGELGLQGSSLWMSSRPLPQRDKWLQKLALEFLWLCVLFLFVLFLFLLSFSSQELSSQKIKRIKTFPYLNKELLKTPSNPLKTTICGFQLRPSLRNPCYLSSRRSSKPNTRAPWC